MLSKANVEKTRSLSVASSIGIGNPMLMNADSGLSGQGPPMMDFDFSSMISELHMAIQEKDTALLSAEQFNRKLIEQVERLQMQLVEKTSALEHTVQQNALLRENIYELQNRADALEDATMEKDSNLQQLEMNLHHYQEESEALKRNRAATSDIIEQARRVEKDLSIEVANTKRNSIFVQQEAVKLSQDLKKAHRQIESMAKANERLEQRAKEAERFKESCEEENWHIRNELNSLKSMIESKTFELIDAQRELVSLREQIGDDRQEDHAFGLLETIEDSDTTRKNTSSNSNSDVDDNTENKLEKKVKDVESLKRDSFDEADDETRKSIQEENFQEENLLVMLRGTDDYEEAQLEADGEEKGSDSEGVELVTDEYFTAQDCAYENKQDDIEVPRVSVTKRDAQKANKDMLVVFLYLTAAAVKYQHSEVEIKTAELIILGQGMPFWELYPFFMSVFETLKVKNEGVANNEERKSSKLGSWFGWMKRKRKVKSEPVESIL